MVAMLSARKFVGYPLCRNEEWIDIMIKYTVDAFASVQAIAKLPAWTHALLASSLPEIKNLKEYQIQGARLLRPYLEERLERLRDPSYKPPIDLTQ